MGDLNEIIRNIGESLVREYLHKKKYTSSLGALEIEMPRNTKSINSRKTLIKELNIGSLFESGSKTPVLSIIETMIKYFIHKSKVKQQKKFGPIKCERIISEQLFLMHNFELVSWAERSLINNSLSQTINKISLFKIYRLKMNFNYSSTNSQTKLKLTGKQGIERDEKGEPTTEPQYKFQYHQKGPKEYKDKAESRLRDKEQVLMSSFSMPDSTHPADKTDSRDTVLNKMKSKDNSEAGIQKDSLGVFRKNFTKSGGDFKLNSKDETLEERDEKQLNGGNNKEIVTGANCNELLRKCEVLHSSAHNFISPPRNNIAYDLKKLIIGCAKRFPSQWAGQSFIFSNYHKARYGLVQTKGGCCGVLATVQAYILKALLYGDNNSCECTEPLRPSRNDIRSALVQALTDILWQAGSSNAILAIAQTVTLETEFNFESMLDNLTYIEYTSKKSLEEGIINHLDYFSTPGSNGCLLFVISALLSRGIQSVIGDMDDETCSLIGDNGFCSLELVNLLLTGYAVSNVFDNSLQIDSCTLRGINSRANIGFLSLYEHYNSCQVGSNLKTPRYPIWVVNSENHFTVLFSCQKELVSDWRAERQFVLYHYDAMHSTPHTKLTVDTTGLYEANTYQGENVPPLEHCIRTKWKGAVIKWHC